MAIPSDTFFPVNVIILLSSVISLIIPYPILYTSGGISSSKMIPPPLWFYSKNIKNIPKSLDAFINIC